MAQRLLHVFALILGISLAAAGRTAAQGNPTGTVSGHVVDQAGLAVPGATVTASSPALQGVRTATTSENGDYIIPFLPAGDYDVKFELQGFKTTTRPVSVKMAETLPLNVTLAIAAVAESVTVTGASPDIVKLEPADLHLPRLRYNYPEPYAPAEFQRTHNFMVAWGLIKPESTFEKLVSGRVTA